MAGLPLPVRLVLSAAGAILLPFTGASAAGAAGHLFTATYSGLIQGASLAESGTVRVTINRGGRGTLVLQLGKITKRIAVVETEAGEIVAVSKHPALAVDLKSIPVVVDSSGPSFTGTLGSGADAISVSLMDATREMAAITTSALGLAGSYTLVLKSDAPPTPGSADLAPLAGLTGIGTVQVSGTGAVTFYAALSDGTQFMQAGMLDSAGGWMLYATAANGAVLSGEVAFANAADSDFSGAVQWQIPASAKIGTPETNTGLQLLGSHYLPAQGWELTAAPVLVASEDDGATASVTANPTVFGNLLIAEGSNSATFAMDRTTGLVLGGYGAVSGLHVAAGIIFQKTNSVYGLEEGLTGLTSVGGLMVSNAVSATGWLEGAASARQLSAILKSIKLGTPGIFAVETPVAGSSDSGGDDQTGGGTLTLDAGDGGDTQTGGATLSVMGSGDSSGGATVSGGTLTINGGDGGTVQLGGTYTYSPIGSGSDTYESGSPTSIGAVDVGYYSGGLGNAAGMLSLGTGGGLSINPGAGGTLTMILPSGITFTGATAPLIVESPGGSGAEAAFVSFGSGATINGAPVSLTIDTTEIDPTIGPAAGGTMTITIPGQNGGSPTVEATTTPVQIFPGQTVSFDVGAISLSTPAGMYWQLNADGSFTLMQFPGSAAD